MALALALAEPRPARAQSAPPPAAQKPRPKVAEPRARRTADRRAKRAAPPNPPKAEAKPLPASTTDAPEASVRAAGTGASEKPAAPKEPIKEQETADGVKRYEFGAIDVEGRLRSPQLVYFLRRVRAEFDAAALGHRSFLRELADTRNDAAFR